MKARTRALSDGVPFGAVHYPWASLGTSTAVGAAETESGGLRGSGPVSTARLTVGLTEGEPLFPLVVLFGLNAVDELDKTAFNVLAPEIRRSFGLGISGILGLVAVIELVAILLGLPLAYWADRRSRVRLARPGRHAVGHVLAGHRPGPHAWGCWPPPGPGRAWAGRW